MCEPPKKKHKAFHKEKPSLDRLLRKLETQQAPQQLIHREQVNEFVNYVLFGRCITMDELHQRHSFYAKLRFWFQSALVQCRVDDSSEHSSPPTMSTTLPPKGWSLAAHHGYRGYDQGLHAQIRHIARFFQTMPAPLVTHIPPYPTVDPFTRDEAKLPKGVVNDRERLLEHHVRHWKKVRQNWIFHRQTYLKRYKPSYDFINSRSILSLAFED
uniref:Uncharacterized protein n=1 Tax=Anopheles dirus TaxID=7168 RepID=A0A182NIX8_9DIPT